MILMAPDRRRRRAAAKPDSEGPGGREDFKFTPGPGAEGATVTELSEGAAGAAPASPSLGLAAGLAGPGIWNLGTL
jgi:hypothetical protein